MVADRAEVPVVLKRITRHDDRPGLLDKDQQLAFSRRRQKLQRVIGGRVDRGSHQEAELGWGCAPMGPPLPLVAITASLVAAARPPWRPGPTGLDGLLP